VKSSAWFLAPALILATFIAAKITLYSWKRRDVPGAIPLALIALGAGWWTGVELICLPFHGLIPQAQRLALDFIGVSVLPPAWLAFSFRFTGRMSRFKSGFVWTATAIGLAIVTLFATNDFHHLVLANRQPCGLYWGFIFYANICVLWGLILMTQRMLELPAAYQGQFIVMVVAGLLPAACNLVDDCARPFDGRLNLTPFSFLFSAILVWYGLFRLRILDLLTIPQEMLLDIIKDGILVIDSKHRVLEYNTAAATLLPGLTPHVIGQSASSLEIWPRIQDLCQPGTARTVEVVLLRGEEPAFLEVRSNRFLSNQGACKGSLLLLHDITERRKAQAENDQLVRQLRTALSEVKTLTGLLPICSSCKRIRNKSGTWDRIERYLKENTDATLTHGLCTECAKSMFSDFSTSVSPNPAETTPLKPERLTGNPPDAGTNFTKP
jgi:PAS domain-containing protein